MVTKPSLANWVIIGLMAVTFILILKWVANKWSIPYLQPLTAGI